MSPESIEPTQAAPGVLQPQSCPRYYPQASPLHDNLLNEERLLAILKLIKDLGFSTLFKFLQSFLTIKDKLLNSRAVSFACDVFLPLLQILVSRYQDVLCC